MAAVGREQILEAARQEIREVDARELERELAGPGRPLLLDVREQEEVDAGGLPGARHLPRGLLELEIEALAPDRAAPVRVYCAAGLRSLLAAQTLAHMGYQDVASLRGGFQAWKQQGGPVVVRRGLTAEQRQRYARHLKLPEVGEAGQQTLLASRVLLVGAGGLGSPAAYYLAAAGVGTLGIVDDDVVDASNLQRQILHRDQDQGVRKVDSAERALTALNPGVRVEKHPVRLTAVNALELLRGYDLVVDGCDNFPTRYLLNDASVLLGKPVVHGSIFRFEGQLSVFSPGRGPCYRCLYPEPPPAQMVPNCSEAGVLGVLPGVIGTLQALEALKLLLGVGQPLVGRLLQFDALRQQFREIRLRRDPGCPACGESPSIRELQDYDAFCAGQP